MNIEQELVRRYLYLQENKELILAMCIGISFDDTDILNKIAEFKKYKKNTDDENQIILCDSCIEGLTEKLGQPKYYFMRNPDREIIEGFDKFLLSDMQMEGTDLYRHIEAVKNNVAFLTSFHDMIFELEQQNKKIPVLKDVPTFTVWKILNYVRNYNINNMSKLCALDKYFNLDRYIMTGINWNSGYILDEKESILKYEALDLYPQNCNYSKVVLPKSNQFEEDNYFDIDYFSEYNLTNSRRKINTKFVFNLVNMPMLNEDTKKEVFEALNGKSKKIF